MMMARALAMATALVAWAGLASPAAAAVVLGQTDDFEDGTTQGWFVPEIHPAPPVNVPSGGPAGADDAYLYLTALGGSGPGSRLVVLNDAQWAGDYIAAGVGAITMDLRNSGDTDLYVRLLFENPAGAAITTAVFLPAGSGWIPATFLVGADDLIVLRGEATDILTGVTVLRIFHGEAPEFPPLPVAANLGVDNIEAQSGPVATEAATWGDLKLLFR